MSGLLDTLAALDTRLGLAAYLAALDAWSMGLLLRSDGSRREKWLWSLVIVGCPIVGCVLWYVLGPKPVLASREEEELVG